MKLRASVIIPRSDIRFNESVEPSLRVSKPNMLRDNIANSPNFDLYNNFRSRQIPTSHLNKAGASDFVVNPHNEQTHHLFIAFSES